MIRTEAEQRGFSTVFFQSNHEGALIDKIHELTDTGIDAFIVNFGAYSHTSIALRDALSASAKPTIEVHISDIKKREAFRHTSMTAGACKDMICGQGFPGYIEALQRLPNTCERIRPFLCRRTALARLPHQATVRKKFAALMKAEGFEHYLPTVESVREYAKQTKRFTKPCFQVYVFACVPAELKSRIYQMDLLARAITVTDVKSFLAQIEEVKKIVASGFELSLIPLLTKGRRVRVKAGALKGSRVMWTIRIIPRGLSFPSMCCNRASSSTCPPPI